MFITAVELNVTDMDSVIGAAVLCTEQTVVVILKNRFCDMYLSVFIISVITGLLNSLFQTQQAGWTGNKTERNFFVVG